MWHFHSTRHVSWASIHLVLLVHDSIWLPHNSSVSGFNNVFTFIYITIVHPCTRRYLLCLFLSAASWIVSNPVFTMCILIVIPFVMNSLVWIWMWIFSNVVQNGIEWICLCVFPSLVAHVVFCCYSCWLDVLSVACDYSPCSGDCILYDLLWWLWSPFPTIVPWVHSPPSSHWTTTVDPMGIDTKICEVSLFGSFLPCRCVSCLWCLSSLSTLTGFPSNTGIIPHTGWLNSNITRLGRPCPSGVVLICSNAMCTSPPESEQFLYCT